jgi:hypothetical protein
MKIRRQPVGALVLFLDSDPLDGTRQRSAVCEFSRSLQAGCLLDPCLSHVVVPHNDTLTVRCMHPHRFRTHRRSTKPLESASSAPPLAAPMVADLARDVPLRAAISWYCSIVLGLRAVLLLVLLACLAHSTDAAQQFSSAQVLEPQL